MEVALFHGAKNQVHIAERLVTSPIVKCVNHRTIDCLKNFLLRHNLKILTTKTLFV